MTCSFCRKAFSEGEAELQCQRCSLGGTGCQMIRCPHCGYEMAREPRVLVTLRRWMKRLPAAR